MYYSFFPRIDGYLDNVESTFTNFQMINVMLIFCLYLIISSTFVIIQLNFTYKVTWSVIQKLSTTIQLTMYQLRLKLSNKCTYITTTASNYIENFTILSNHNDIFSIEMLRKIMNLICPTYFKGNTQPT